MKKHFYTGALVFTIDETDVKWNSKNQTGGLPITSIIAINYSVGSISLVCNGFVEKIMVPNTDQSRAISVKMNNCVSSIKNGDLSVLETPVLTPKTSEGWQFTGAGKWIIGGFILLVGMTLFGKMETWRKESAEKERIEREKAAFDSLPQATKDSIAEAKAREEQEIAETIRKGREEQERFENKEAAEFAKSKAGRIWKKHPEWSKQDCKDLANNKIWIGMHINMLKYKRGLPNSANPSNYGSVTHWQWCWYDYTPSCFYDNDGDGLVEAYN